MLRRLVLLFMIFALPLQLTWAAAGVYCGHETGSAARHFGHHDHVHKTSDSDKSGTQGNGGVDQDCSFHSHAGVQGLPASQGLVAVHQECSVQNATGACFHSQAVLNRPDRPKWSAT